MDRTETKQILMRLSTLFPNFKVTDLSLMIDTWHEYLADYTYNDVKGAIKIFVSTDKGGFAPSISQIIGIIQETYDDGRLTDMEVWDAIYKASSNSGYESVEEFNKLPEILQRVVGSPTVLKQWAMTDTQELFSYVRPIVVRNYNSIYEHEKNRFIMGIEKSMPNMIDKGSDYGERQSTLPCLRGDAGEIRENE